MDSGERKMVPPAQRVWTSIRRAGYLFGIAFLFRLQLWLFGLPGSTWSDLFRVDILNCMGFAILLMAPMALFRTLERVRLCAIVGLGIALASPLLSQWNWSAVPVLLKNYLAPDFNFFSFFPWASYLAFGISAGSLIRVLRPEQTERAMQWLAIAGAVLIMSCQYFGTMPYGLYAKSDYWLNSPLQVLTKLGVILLALPFAFLWNRYATSEGWSWVRQFGVTSLLVYWVHIELIYGRWLYFWKNNLNVAETVLVAVLVILLMLALSTLKTHRDRWLPALSTWRGGFPVLRPDRVPGD
jgi:hypothetical protein